MSLDAAFADLTTALNANTAALQAMMATAKGKAAAPAEPEAAEAPKGRGRPKKDNDEATKAAEPAKKAEAPKGPPSVEEVRKAFSDYLGIDDKAVRDARMEEVRSIVTEIGVSKATEIPEESRAQAIAWVEDFKAGRKPNYMADAGDEGGSDLI